MSMSFDFKWHFRLPQACREGEVVGSTPTWCMCNLTIKNRAELCLMCHMLKKQCGWSNRQDRKWPITESTGLHRKLLHPNKM